MKNKVPFRRKRTQTKKAETVTKLQERFLAAYMTLGQIHHAAEAAKTARSNHWRWLEESELYAEAFVQAKEIALEILLREAQRRAAEGVSEPVYYQGKVCGHVQKYSDILLMFLIKGLAPEKYRENHHHEHSGSIDIVAKIREGRDRLAKRKGQ